MRLLKVNYNDRRLYVLSFLLLLPLLLIFLTAIRGSNNSIFTMIIYGISFVFLSCWAIRDISIINVYPIIIYLLLSIYSASYSPQTLEYISSMPFLISSFFYFPLSALVIFRIEKWGGFFRIFRPFAILGCFMAAYMAFFCETTHEETDLYNYMDFAYAVLPVSLGLYVYARSERSIIDLVICLMSLVSILSFGARATVLFAICFIIYYEVVTNKVNKWHIILALGVIAIMYLNIDGIVRSIAELPIFENSRIITSYLNEKVFESSSRDIIINACQKRLDTIVLECPGFFGDRPYLNGAIYPHNFFYEVIMDFGWLFGIILLIWMAYIVYKDYFIKNYHILTVYLLLSLFGRYLISGSYIIEGKFWIFIFSILSISHYSIKYNTIEHT